MNFRNVHPIKMCILTKKTIMQKVFTTSGRRIKRSPSSYEKFINAHIQLGKDFKSAYNEWKLLNARIQINSLNLQN